MIESTGNDLLFETKDGKKASVRKDAVIRVEQQDETTTLIGLSDGTTYTIGEPIDKTLKVVHESPQPANRGTLRPQRKGRQGGGSGDTGRADRLPRGQGREFRSRQAEPDPVLSDPSRLNKMRGYLEESRSSSEEGQREAPSQTSRS